MISRVPRKSRINGASGERVHARGDYVPFSTGNLAICQAIIPFFMLLAVYPAAIKILAAGTLRCPLAQMQTTSRSLRTSSKRQVRIPQAGHTSCQAHIHF
jgi:hypothetical protein